MGDVLRTNTTTTTIAKSGSGSNNNNTRSLITRSSTRCSPTAAARDISEARIISLTRSYGLDVDEVERAHLASLPNDRARKVRCRTLLLGERSDRCGGLARASTFVAPRLAMDEEREDKGKAKTNACGGGYVGYGYVGGSAAAAARADAGVGRNNLASPDYFEDLDLGRDDNKPTPSPLRRPWTWPGFRSLKRSTTSSSPSSSSSSSTTTLPLYTVRSLPLDPPSPLTTSIPPLSPRLPLPPTSTSSPRHVDSSSLAHGLHDPRTPYATTPASGSSSASTLSSYRTAATATTSSTATVVPPPPPSEASASLLSEDLARVLTPASTMTTTTFRDGEACERQGGEGEGEGEGDGIDEWIREFLRWSRLISLALNALLIVVCVALFVALIVLLVQKAVREASGGKEGEEA